MTRSGAGRRIVSSLSSTSRRRRPRQLCRRRSTAGGGGLTAAAVDAAGFDAAARSFSNSNSNTRYYEGDDEDDASSLFRVDDDTGFVYDRRRLQDGETSVPLYRVVIGLEVHAQLDIPTKLFSSAPSPTFLSSARSRRQHHQRPPNSHAYPFDAAVPGTMPVLSRDAAQKAATAAAALRCDFSGGGSSRFERKHYPYADSPHGYQITQQRWPLAANGEFRFPYGNGNGTAAGNATTTKKEKKKKKRKDENATAKASNNAKPPSSSCRIHRIQLEQDTGKTTTTTTTSVKSDDDGATTTTTTTVSLVDLDRAGAALIEIVTAPDLRAPNEAAAAVRYLRQLLVHAGVCRGRMQDGQLRVDANVNIEKIPCSRRDDDDDDDAIGLRRQQFARTPRVEVKNLNSIQQVAAATSYEALRQAAVVAAAAAAESESGAPFFASGAEETRTWNAATCRTVLLRRKDQADDYRFLPEPDLPPLVLDESVFGAGVSLEDFVASCVPELPEAAVERLANKYSLTEYQASVLAASDPGTFRLFEQVMKLYENRERQSLSTSGETPTKQGKQFAKLALNLLCNELFAFSKERAAAAQRDDGEDNEETSFEQQHSSIAPEQLATITEMLVEGSISSTMAKKLLKIVFVEDEQRRQQQEGEEPPAPLCPRQVAEERGLKLITDRDELVGICRRVMEEDVEPDELRKYRRGGRSATKLRKLFTGKAMSASEGNAHPERLQEALQQVLDEIAPGAS